MKTNTQDTGLPLVSATITDKTGNKIVAADRATETEIDNGDISVSSASSSPAVAVSNSVEVEGKTVPFSFLRDWLTLGELQVSLLLLPTLGVTAVAFFDDRRQEPVILSASEETARDAMPFIMETISEAYPEFRKSSATKQEEPK